MPDVASLNVVISADTKDLEAGLSRAEQSVSKAGSAIQAAMGGALIAGVAGLGAALVGSVKSAADFEKQISGIVAVSGEGAESIGRIRDEALRLGKDTSFSASEAAAGMEEMIKAGLSVEQVIGGAAQATLDLAAASGTAVAESATIMSNALNIFKADGMAAADAASILAGAANASATSVHELGYGLSSVGAVAAQVGLHFDETATALAILAQNGLKGADAGTSLKAMLNNLVPATDKASAEFNKLGLNTFDTQKAMELLRSKGLQPVSEEAGALGNQILTQVIGAKDWLTATKKQKDAYDDLMKSSGTLRNAFFDEHGTIKSVAEISEILKNQLGDLTKEQQILALQTLFGTDGQRAASLLMKEGAAAVTEMSEAMKKQGDIQKLAGERLNNVMGSLEKLKGSLETGAIVLGSMFLPALKGALDGLTEFANQGITALEMLPDAWKDVVAAFTGGQMDDYLDTLLTDVLGFSGGTAQAFEDVIRTAGEMWSGLQPILAGIGTAIQENIAPIAAFVAGFLGAIGTVGLFTAAIAAVTAVLTLLLSPIGLVAIAVGLLAAAWTTNFLGIQEATAAAWAYLLPIFTQIVDWLGPKISAVLTWLTTTGWPMMLEAGRLVGEWITGTLIPTITTLIDWLGPKLSAVVTWIYTVGWPGLVTAGEKVWAVVGEIQKFFALLYIELDKREVFTTLARLWDELVAAGDKVWAVIKKMDEIFRPFQQLTAEFNAGPGKALVGTFGLMGTSGETAGKGIDIVALAAKSMGIVFEIALAPLKRFLEDLKALGELIEKAKSWTLPSFTLSGGVVYGGATGPASTMTPLSYQATTSGGFMNNAERLAFVGEMATKYGHDPATVQRGATLEGAGAAGPVGDSGMSFGALQAYTGGGMGNTFQQVTGLDPRDPNNEKALVEWQIGQLRNTGWTPYNGPTKRGGFSQFQGIGTGSRSPGVMDRISLAPSSMPPREPWLPNAGVSGGFTDVEKGLDSIGIVPQTMEQIRAVVVALGSAMAVTGDTTAGLNGKILELSDVGAGATKVVTELGNGALVTMVDATGAITAQWTEMAGALTTTTQTAAASVVADTNMMGTGVVAQVTDMGGQIITKLTETSGLSSTTVAAMGGTILSQMTTLKDGTVVQMDDMGVRVTTAFNTMSQLTTTTVTTMAGTIITTTTDMNGQIVAQTISTGLQVQQQWVTTSAAVIATATQMGLEVLGQSRVMGEGLVTATKTSTGEMVSIITNAAGEVIGQFKNIVKEGVTVATGLDAAKKGLASYADGLKGVGSAARKAAEDLAEFNKQAGGGKASEFAKGTKSSGSFGKAAGGSVNANQLYMVGEQGPELFMSNTNGTIIPNDRLGSGGPVTVVNVSVGGSLVAQSELEDTIARAVATSLRGGSLAWSN